MAFHHEARLTSGQAALFLFGTDFYFHYQRFQCTIKNEDQVQYYASKAEWELTRDSMKAYFIGELPEPHIYKLFMNWLRLQGNLYRQHEEQETSLVVARLCRHTIHPGNTITPEEVDACPVCVMDQCTKALQRIWNVWWMLGGPYSNFYEDERRIYFRLRGIWRVEKQRWANLVDRYEEVAEYEEAWEEENLHSSPYSLEELEKAQSCSAALRIAKTRNPDKMDGEDVIFTPRPFKRSTVQPLASNPSSPPQSPEHSTIHSLAEIPSSPPVLPCPEYIRSESPSPSSQITAQHLKLPSALPKQTPSPPSSPKLAREDSPIPSTPPEKILSASIPPSSTIPATSPQSFRLLRKKKVRFELGNGGHEVRSLLEFNRFSIRYKRGWYACLDQGGWEDTSFKNEPRYTYDNEVVSFESDNSIEDEGIWVESETVPEEFDYEVDYIDDAEFESDENSDSSTTAVVDGANDGSARQHGQITWVSADPWDTQEDFQLFDDLDSDEFDDPEVEEEMMTMDIDAAAGSHGANESPKLPDRGELVGQPLQTETTTLPWGNSPMSNVGLQSMASMALMGGRKIAQVLGRRDRRSFETASAGSRTSERTEVKRQCRPYSI